MYLIIVSVITLSSVTSFASTHMPKTPTINVAVASNFKLTALDIAQQFNTIYGIKVNIVSASTATLYKQILHGAPFQLFLSADKKHIQLLIDKQRASNDDAFVYAQGKLVFWQPQATETLTIHDFLNYAERLAIANPSFAPYGLAAEQTLRSVNKWQKQPYVKGNNINQTYQFVESGNVPAGLVAYSSIIQSRQNHYFIIPQNWYQPLQQVGIILGQQQEKETNLFRQFLLSDNIQHYITSQGYN